MKRQIQRGDIYFADFEKLSGSVQTGVRPCLIIQNWIGNKYSPSTIVLPLTTKKKNKLKVHVLITNEDLQQGNLNYDSVVLCEQIRTIDKKMLKNKIGQIKHKKLETIEKAVSLSIACLPKDSDQKEVS